MESVTVNRILFYIEPKAEIERDSKRKEGGTGQSGRGKEGGGEMREGEGKERGEREGERGRGKERGGGGRREGEGEGEGGREEKGDGEGGGGHAEKTQCMDQPVRIPVSAPECKDKSARATRSIFINN